MDPVMGAAFRVTMTADRRGILLWHSPCGQDVREFLPDVALGMVNVWAAQHRCRDLGPPAAGEADESDGDAG